MYSPNKKTEFIVKNRFPNICLFLYYFCCFFVVLQGYADSLVFENGDRISGELMNETRTEYVFKTEYGVLRVPINKVDYQKEEQTERSSTSNETQESEDQPQTSLEMLVTAKMKLRDHFPKEWKGRFSTSLEFLNSSNDRFGIQEKFSTYRKMENQRYDLSAHYAYSKVSKPDGISIRTRDEYGAEMKHTWDFSERYFSSNEFSYLRDEQRDIKFQAQPSSALGYRIVDKTDLELSVQLGPSLRLIEADELDTNQVDLVNFGQRLRYELNSHFKFLQSLDYFRSFNSAEIYNTIFKATIASNLTDLLDTRLSYIFNHNSIVGRDREQRQGRLTLSLGVPF